MKGGAKQCIHIALGEQTGRAGPRSSKLRKHGSRRSSARLFLKRRTLVMSALFLQSGEKMRRQSVRAKSSISVAQIFRLGDAAAAAASAS